MTCKKVVRVAVRYAGCDWADVRFGFSIESCDVSEYQWEGARASDVNSMARRERVTRSGRL